MEKNVKFKHKFGNIISGFCGVIDGLVLIFTLGNYQSKNQLNWNIYRKSTGKFLS